MNTEDLHQRLKWYRQEESKAIAQLNGIRKSAARLKKIYAAELAKADGLSIGMKGLDQYGNKREIVGFRLILGQGDKPTYRQITKLIANNRPRQEALVNIVHLRD